MMKKKEIRKIAEFLLNAQQGEKLKLNDFVITKNFKLEDVGFTYINGKYYTYDPYIGRGKRVSKEYILEILMDTISTYPEEFFEEVSKE